MEQSDNTIREGRRFWGPVPLLFSVSALVLLIGVFALVQFGLRGRIGYDGSFPIDYSELLRAHRLTRTPGAGEPVRGAAKLVSAHPWIGKVPVAKPAESWERARRTASG